MSHKDTVDFTIETTEGELDIELEVEGYRMGRDAPVCSNPDSPRYSDCGDDADWDYVNVYIGQINITSELPKDYLDDKVEMIVTHGDEHFLAMMEGARHDKHERDMEERRDR